MGLSLHLPPSTFAAQGNQIFMNHGNYWMVVVYLLRIGSWLFLSTRSWVLLLCTTSHPERDTKENKSGAGLRRDSHSLVGLWGVGANRSHGRVKWCQPSWGEEVTLRQWKTNGRILPLCKTDVSGWIIDCTGIMRAGKASMIGELWAVARFCGGLWTHEIV